MDEGKITCEDCKWYEFIDSGYSYCKRFPPVEKLTKIFPHIESKIEYTIVPWDFEPCGEFKKRK